MIANRIASIRNHFIHVTATRSALLAVVLLFLLVVSRFFAFFGWPALAIVWPAIWLLGGDELQERYGYWGEIGLEWALSLPWIILCALAYSYIAVQDSSTPSRRKNNDE